MTKEKLNSFIERAGKQAGFECPECGGSGRESADCKHHNIDIEKHIDARLSWECAE